MDIKAIDKLIGDSTNHRWYQETVYREREMTAWFKARNTYSLLYTEKNGLEWLFPKSGKESSRDYADRIKRLSIFPLEYKFFSAQQRIYSENNVQRRFPKDTKDFWEDISSHFDDQGDSVTHFFKNKVLFQKECLGFGAIVLDNKTNPDGSLKTDAYNKPIPYPTVVGAHEILNFNQKQGELTFLLIKQERFDSDGDRWSEWRAFDDTFIHIWKQKEGEDRKFSGSIAHGYGEVPAILLKGAPDPDSGYRIGRPRRYNLTSIYRALSELFYDLQEGSLLFAHPIPVYSEDIVKSLMGITDANNQEYSNDRILETLGRIVIYPSGTQPPNTLFYHADMSGLAHLTKIIFEDLIETAFLMANVRYKITRPHNVSGTSKQFDQLDEKGLLMDTAEDMEILENKLFQLMAKRRGEEFEEPWVIYSKHFDLSSITELFNYLHEGFQYGSINTSMYKYLTTEIMRKLSAPLDMQEDNLEEVNNEGIPMNAKDITAWKGIMNTTQLILKARPELLSDSVREQLIATAKEFGLEDTNVPASNQTSEQTSDGETQAEEMLDISLTE